MQIPCHYTRSSFAKFSAQIVGHMRKKKIIKPTSPYATKKLKEAGLPPPNPGLSQSQFAKLQKEWYDKLADDGFKDLEWVDHKTGKGQNSDWLRGSLIGGKKYHAGRAIYYQLADNYLTHCKSLRGYNRFIWKRHAAGETYSEILDAVSAKYKNAPSLYTVYYQLQHLAKLCYKWNVSHAEGLLKKRREEKEAIEQSALADFYVEEYNWLINRAYAKQMKG